MEQRLPYLWTMQPPGRKVRVSGGGLLGNSLIESCLWIISFRGFGITPASQQRHSSVATRRRSPRRDQVRQADTPAGSASTASRRRERGGSAASAVGP